MQIQSRRAAYRPAVRRAQGGFVQGVLIIGLALMAVVVAAFAMASSNSNTDIGKQKARAAASVGMKKVADTVEAYQILVAETNTAQADTDIAGKLPKMAKDFNVTGFVQSTDVTYDSATGKLAIAKVDETVCGEINRALGIDTAPADLAAVTADIREACTADETYVRVLKNV